MNTSNNNNNSANGPTATHQQQQQPAQSQGNFVVFLPPPPTVWIQFNGGMQIAFTPSPGQYLQSVLNGVPLFGSSPSEAANGNNSNGILNALNELFQRAQSQQHGPPPTSKPFLDKLPVKTWTQNMQKTENYTECVICLSDYEKEDTIISLPCGHTFHKDCGMTWLVEHNVCPTCRYQLPTQSETIAAATQTTPTATTEPGQEPASQDTASSITGVRRQRSTEAFHPRDVRQRVDEPTLASADEDAEMDLMLEQEADRFVKEEMEKGLVSEDDSVEIDDRDVEELLHETSSTTTR